MFAPLTLLLTARGIAGLVVVAAVIAVVEVAGLLLIIGIAAPGTGSPRVPRRVPASGFFALLVFVVLQAFLELARREPCSAALGLLLLRLAGGNPGQQGKLLAQQFEDVIGGNDADEFPEPGDDRDASHPAGAHALGYIENIFIFRNLEQGVCHDVSDSYLAQGNVSRDDFDHDVTVGQNADRYYLAFIPFGDNQTADMPVAHQSRGIRN
jgi:hypothetical protein